MLHVTSLAVALVLLSAAASAQPAITTVSGQWAHQGAVTVAGSGFGTKPVAAPVVWDNASGTSILGKWDGAWPACGGNAANNLGYRTPAEAARNIPLPHNRITKYISGAHNPGTGANCGYNVIMFKTRTVTFPAYTYATWYERSDDNWSFGDDDNYKTFAYSVGTTPYELPNNWYLEYNPRPTSRTSSAAYHLNDDNGSLQTPDQNGHNWWWAGAINPMSGTWKKVEVEARYTNQNDGYVKLWENGVLKVDYKGRTDAMAGTQRTEGIGGYARRYGFASNWRFFADVYLDYSRARVILGNAATFSASTIREVQVPTTWSAGSISISANLGAFANGQTVYLYVVDPNGTVNAAGYPVVLGTTTTDNTPPTVATVLPASGATSVSAATNVFVTFSEPMNPATISTSTIELRNSSNTLVSGIVTYDAVTWVARFDSAATLSTSQTYTATVRGGAAGVKDAAGNPLAANYAWSFTTSATAPPPSTGPVLALGFEEATGVTAIDSSGHANTGVISGGTRVTGRFGGGLQLDGVDDWVTVLDAASLDLTSGMTLEAWVRPSALSGWRTLMMKETADGLAYALYANDTNASPVAYVRRIGATASDPSAGTSALSLNGWTHLATTYDGTTLRLFVNGIEVRAAAAPGTVVTSNSVLHIGGNGIWGEFFAGVVDEVRVYNRALSSIDIQADMNTAVAAGMSTDTTPPTVFSVAPPANAMSVGLTANVTAIFSETMQAGTVAAATVELRNAATNALVAAAVTYNSTLKAVTLDPSASLVAGTQYRATIMGGAAGVKDAAGNAMTADYTWTFTAAAPPTPPQNLRVIR
jgi:hypothetical protein